MSALFLIPLCPDADRMLKMGYLSLTHVVEERGQPSPSTVKVTEVTSQVQSLSEDKFNLKKVSDVNISTAQVQVNCDINHIKC